MKVRKIVAGLAAVSMLAAFSAQVVAAADTGSSNTTSVIIIVVTNVVLILIGVCLYLVGSKKK